MFTQLFLKNKNYKISQRDYTSDYANNKKKIIDMTLSGRYLAGYGNLNIDSSFFDRYPSKDNLDNLIKEIKSEEKIDKEIIIGAGANGLLQNIIKMFFITKGNLVTPFYTFDEAEFAVTSFKGVTKRVYLDNYNINFEKLFNSIDRNTKMIYICNPNNLTGIYTDSSKIIEFCQKVHVPVVIDESGIDFTNKKSILSYSNLPNNLLVIRSFSKTYGLANLRIGYLVCSNKFKKLYQKMNTINDISDIAIISARHQLKNKDNIKKNINKILLERDKIINKLEQIGIKCLKSDSNVIMTETCFSPSFIDKLLKEDIGVVLVYDEKDNIHMRIAVQDEEINDEFIDKIAKIYK